MNPLIQAIEQHDVKRAKNLIAENSDWISKSDDDLESDFPLHIAAWQNIGEIVELLIQSGADLDARGDGGYTPLHYAAREGSVDSALLLLSAGANPNLEDNAGWLPLLRAVRGREPSCLEVARVLINNGSKTDLNSLVSIGETGKVCQLLEEDEQAIINAPMPQDLIDDVVIMMGEKILEEAGYEATLEAQQAVVNKYQSGLSCLIDAGIDINQIGTCGQPPLFGSVQMGHLAVTRLLLENGANPNLRLQEGNRLVNALHFTSGAQSNAMRRLLVEFGFED